MSVALAVLEADIAMTGAALLAGPEAACRRSRAHRLLHLSLPCLGCLCRLVARFFAALVAVPRMAQSEAARRIAVEDRRAQVNGAIAHFFEVLVAEHEYAEQHAIRVCLRTTTAAAADILWRRWRRRGRVPFRLYPRLVGHGSGGRGDQDGGERRIQGFDSFGPLPSRRYPRRKRWGQMRRASRARLPRK